MKNLNLKGKTALVIGLGESGMGAARLLKTLGARVRITDLHCDDTLMERVHLLSSPGIEVELGTHSKNFCKDADFAILSPGIPIDIPLLQWLRQDQIPVYGELEWGSRFLHGKIIAVTGSNGKSTTSTLIWKILKEHGLKAELAGNIGRGLCNSILEDEGTQFWILEVSSFQLESIEKFRPWISCLLNITSNHMDRYSTQEDYIRSKLNIFKNQGAGDWAVVNSSLAPLASMDVETLFVDPQKPEGIGAFIENGWIKVSIPGSCREIMPIKEIPIPGNYFIENVMFASAVALLCDVPAKTIRKAVKEFKGLEHRQEIFGTWDGISWVNDSKSTSVDAARKALETFDAPLIWIAGGRFKGGDFESLRGLVSQKVREIHLYGKAANVISKFLKGACPIFTHGPLHEAIRSVQAKARKGETIIFSPGCSSFDQFRNFEERGKFFKEQVIQGYVLAETHIT